MYVKNLIKSDDLERRYSSPKQLLAWGARWHFLLPVPPTWAPWCVFVYNMLLSTAQQLVSSQCLMFVITLQGVQKAPTRNNLVALPTEYDNVIEATSNLSAILEKVLKHVNSVLVRCVAECQLEYKTKSLLNCSVHTHVVVKILKCAIRTHIVRCSQHHICCDLSACFR